MQAGPELRVRPELPVKFVPVSTPQLRHFARSYRAPVDGKIVGEEASETMKNLSVFRNYSLPAQLTLAVGGSVFAFARGGGMD